MAYHYIEDPEGQIIENTIFLGATKGIHNISTKEVGKLCGASEFIVFSYFKTKKNLIDSAAMKIDKEIMEKALHGIKENISFEKLFLNTLNYLVNHPNDALFYFAYINFYGFDPTENNIRAAEFLATSRTLFANKKDLTDHEILILWDYMTTMCFYYSEKFIHGFMPYNEENISLVKKLAFEGYNSI